MGSYGIGDRDDRGERLLQFAQEEGKYMRNTYTKNKEAQQEVDLAITGRS